MTGNVFTAGFRREGSSWDQFDSFPREIRDAMNYALIQYSTKSIARLLRRLPVAIVIERINSRDAEAMEVFAEEREANELLASIGL